ncbi:MAG: hypothetical protein R3C05_11370 [Pirellulaceae bacterium]
MGPLRKFRIIFWPTAASAAVIGLLFVFEREQSQHQVSHSERRASTAPMLRPTTISDNEKKPGPRVAWTGPSLSREPFARDELTYPFPPASGIDLNPPPPADLASKVDRQETRDAKDLKNATRPKIDRPVVIETLESNTAGVSGDNHASDDTEFAYMPPEVPSVLLIEGPANAVQSSDTEREPLTLETPTAVLSAPIVDEQDELAGLAPPQAIEDPFPQMRMSSNRVDPLQRVPEATSPSPSPESATYPEPNPAVQPSVESPLQRSELVRQPTQWPQTPALDALLKRVESLNDGGVPWSNQVRQTIVDLQQEPKLGTPRAGELIERLRCLSEEAYGFFDEDADLTEQRIWVAAAYALERRVDVWHAVWNNIYTATTGVRQDRPEAIANVSQLIANLRQQVTYTRDTADWQRFLMLDEIEAASKGNVSDAQRRLIAQRYLSRVQYTELSETQREWLRESDCKQLGEMIRSWAHGPVDYVALLDQIEVQETDAIDRDGGRIAATMQTLRFSNHQQTYAVAEAINRHYRNANLRLSISSEMLNRMLPDVPSQQQPIRDHVLGASVLGTSVTKADLHVELQPSPDAWRIRLLSRGNVTTSTRSSQGPATLSHTGNAGFDAATVIQVDRGGVDISQPQVAVESNQQLRRLRTDYDGFPILGPLVREYVKQRHNETRGYANAYSRNKIRSQVEQQMVASLQQQLNDAEESFSSRLIGPLAMLGMKPTVVDMSTTDDRLTVRYRLSGDWQLGSFTPRPRAPSTSLMSLQLHQSTLNNAIARLVPFGEAVPVDQAVGRALQVFGFAGTAAADAMPDDVSIQFTSTRPVTVEIADDALVLTMRIVRLDQTDGINLRNFIVKATYVPQIDGVRPMLVRDGPLNISGPRMGMGDRVAVRTIFNRVLTANRPLQLTSDKLLSHPAMEGLAITQFELRDGWIGFAIGDEAHFMADAALYSMPMKR